MIKAILGMLLIGYAVFACIAFPFLLMRAIQYRNFILNDEYFDWDRYINDIKEGRRRRVSGGIARVPYN